MVYDSNIFYFHPYLGKIPNLTNIFCDRLKPPTRWWFIGCLVTNWPWPRCLHRSDEELRSTGNGPTRPSGICMPFWPAWSYPVDAANQLRVVDSTNYLQGLIDLSWCRNLMPSTVLIWGWAWWHGHGIPAFETLKIQISDWKIQTWWCLNWKEWVLDLFLGPFLVLLYQPVRYHSRADMGSQMCGKRLDM